MAYKQRNWPEILKEINESGLTLKEYSELSDIPYSTLCNHRHKAKIQTLSEPQESSAALGFVRVEAKEVEDNSSSGVRIRVGNCVIEVEDYFQVSVLAKVLEVLHAGA